MDSVEQNIPLVSIIVITYNSAKYVLETLESAKAQTYQNIELIISDDASQDDTVEICKNWLSHNRERFVRTDLITVVKNTGISANCNRGVNLSKGEWIKLIAGDDILIESCIQDYVTYSSNNPDAKIIFARTKELKNNYISNDVRISIFDSNQLEQTKIILKGSGLKAPTSFLKRSLIIEVGGFNEKYPMLEDLPMWVKFTLNGYKFYCTNTFTVIHRMHDSNISVSNKGGRHHINMFFYESLRRYITLELNPILKKRKLYNSYFNNLNLIVINDLIIALGNKNNSISKAFSLLILNSTIKRLKNFLK